MSLFCGLERAGFRPAFLNAVLPLVDSKRTHFDKRCTAISAATSGTNVLHFADGTTHEADLIIGADGIRSVVREAVAGTEKVLQFTNTVAYRGLVPTAALQRDGVKTDLTKRLLCFVGIDKVSQHKKPERSNDKLSLIHI